MTKKISEKENLKLVFEGREPAWVPNYMADCARVITPALPRVKDPKTGYGVDPFGVAFITTPDGHMPANTKSGNFELKDIKKWREVMPGIDLSAIDWEGAARKARATEVREGQMVDFYAGFVWEQLHYLMGYEKALLALVRAPEAAHEALNAFADFWIEAMRRQYKYLKPDMICFVEHLANAQNLLMSPKTYRTVIKPVHKKMFEAVIELGAIPCLHVDGYIEPLIPDFAELGVKAIQPFQIYNEINADKTKYDLVAIGGWDAFGRGNQADSTEEEVRQSVRLAMDLYAPGGRYIFWASGVTPVFQNHESWINDEAGKYGRAFYGKK